MFSLPLFPIFAFFPFVAYIVIFLPKLAYETLTLPNTLQYLAAI